jgi:hypothetical protein
MAGVGRDDPEQVSYFADSDPNAPLPEPKDVVVPAVKDDDPGGVGDGGRTPGPGERDPLVEQARRGDKKPGRSERAPPPPPRDTPRPDPQEGIDELRAQYDREAEARRRAEQAATQALQRAQMAEARYGQAASGMIDSAIEAAVRASDQAAAKFAASMDISDHKAAAQAQIEISDARANLHRLQEQKQMLADQEAQRRNAPPPQPQGADMAEANLRNITAELEKNGYRKSAQWLRNHPEMVKDREAINRVDGAHGYIVNVKKIPIESDRYFDEMERELLGDGYDPEPAPRRGYERGGRAARPAAPVSSSAPRLRDGQTRRTVHLTSEQRQHARDVLGMTDEEYAAELADAEDRGKLLRYSR